MHTSAWNKRAICWFYSRITCITIIGCWILNETLMMLSLKNRSDWILISDLNSFAHSTHSTLFTHHYHHQPGYSVDMLPPVTRYITMTWTILSFVHWNTNCHEWSMRRRLGVVTTIWCIPCYQLSWQILMTMRPLRLSIVFITNQQ
jgi:hypothetical protein